MGARERKASGLGRRNGEVGRHDPIDGHHGRRRRAGRERLGDDAGAGEGAEVQAEIVTFRAWLLAEAAEDARRIAAPQAVEAQRE